jgi:hypothetical protein
MGRGMVLYRKETKSARRDHGPCDSCSIAILKGQNFYTIYEFNPATSMPGRMWKRHVECPKVAIEDTRLSDEAG